MSNLLYIIAVILIIGWAIGFFAYSAGAVIHILLVIAVIAIIVSVLQGIALSRFMGICSIYPHTVY